MCYNIDVKNFITFFGALISLITLWYGIREYSKKRKQEQAQNFLAIINNLKNIARKEFPAILNDVWNDGENLKLIPYLEKTEFLLLIEEIGILVNSGIIKKEVAIYLFGYWAKCCYSSGNFIRNSNDEIVIDFNDNYWVVFKDFVLKVIEYEKANFKYDAKDFTI